MSWHAIKRSLQAKKRHTAVPFCDFALVWTNVLKAAFAYLLILKVTKSDLTNSVINACFLMLFKDLIRLLACYNDAIINLLGMMSLTFVLSVSD